jgi:aminopeptidase N
LFKAIGSFYKKFRISGATARQFLDDVERSVGRDLGAFFQDWVFSSATSKRIAEGVSLAELLR